METAGRFPQQDYGVRGHVACCVLLPQELAYIKLLPVMPLKFSLHYLTMTNYSQVEVIGIPVDVFMIH